MPKNIILCFDGTNNQFGTENTNVVRLVQSLSRDSSKQHLYYDPGVGTLPEPGFATAIGKKVSDWMGLAFGAGLEGKVQKGYCYLMQVWEPGDRVFLFGFSRGAYTARVLAGLLHNLGLMPRGNDNLVPYVMRLFSSAPKEDGSRKDKFQKWQKLCADFRSTFSKVAFLGDNERHFKVHFLGVWDTVSSVGYVWDPKKYPYTASNPSLDVVRHAVSIDERRWFFRQNLTKPRAGQDHKEYWFAGVHCDVGGGYAETLDDVNPPVYSGMWRTSFSWMVAEAKEAGLIIDEQRYEGIVRRDPPCEEAWLEAKHESLTAGWGIAEIFPKHVWDRKSGEYGLRMGLWGHRDIPAGSLIHKSVLQRIRDASPAYAPGGFSDKFIEKIRGLDPLPEVLPFEELGHRE